MITLARARADLYAKDRNGNTALFLAASNGSANGVQALIESGVEVRDSGEGERAFIVSVDRGHKRVVSVFVTAGLSANLVVDGKTLLMIAADRGHAGTAEALLQGNADINAKDQNGENSLMMAATSRDGETCKSRS